MNEFVKIHLLGQFCLLHEAVSKEFPTHVNPPSDGGGLVQNRNRTLIPPPHDLSQDVYWPQALHAPSTLW